MADGRDSPAVEFKIAIARGRPVRRGRDEPATQGHGWGEYRQLPADVLYDLLAGPGSRVKRRAAVLVGLRITGRLNLEAAELQVPLIAHNCFFDKPINLIGASAPEIRLSACVLPGIDAPELRMRNGFDLSDSRLEIVDLMGAHVGGELVLSGATLTGGCHPVDLGDGTLRPSESASRTTRLGALYADCLEVDKHMFCGEGEGGQRFTADGEICLAGAHIGGQLSFIGAQLTNADGPALNADGLEVDQDMFCGQVKGGERFTADGEIRLLGAHIGGTLVFDGAQLTNANGPALNAERLDVAMLILRRLTSGKLKLVGARIGDLVVDKEQPAGGLPGPLSAAGWEVRDVHGVLRTDRGAASAWLGTSERFVAQPWHALAAVYERNGQPADARILRFRAAHRTTKTAPWWSKPPRWAYGLLVGYGYYPLAAGAWLLAALLTAWALTATHTAAFVPTNPTRAAAAIAPSSVGNPRSPATTPAAPAPAPAGVQSSAEITGATSCDRLGDRYPCLRPLLYSLDVVLPPTVTTGQSTAWRPAINWMAYLLTSLKTFGWLLTALLLAGVTGLLRKT